MQIGHQHQLGAVLKLLMIGVLLLGYSKSFHMCICNHSSLIASPEISGALNRSLEAIRRNFRTKFWRCQGFWSFGLCGIVFSPFRKMKEWDRKPSFPAEGTLTSFTVQKAVRGSPEVALCLYIVPQGGRITILVCFS